MSQGSSSSSSQDSNSNKPIKVIKKKCYKYVDFQKKMLACDLSPHTNLLTETFHGFVMIGQLEINQKSKDDWHLRLNLSEYAETIKDFVSLIIEGFKFP